MLTLYIKCLYWSVYIRIFEYYWYYSCCYWYSIPMWICYVNVSFVLEITLNTKPLKKNCPYNAYIVNIMIIFTACLYHDNVAHCFRYIYFLQYYYDHLHMGAHCSNDNIEQWLYRNQKHWMQMNLDFRSTMKVYRKNVSKRIVRSSILGE